MDKNPLKMLLAAYNLQKKQKNGNGLTLQRIIVQYIKY